MDETNNEEVLALFFASDPEEERRYRCHGLAEAARLRAEGQRYEADEVMRVLKWLGSSGREQPGEGKSL